MQKMFVTHPLGKMARVEDENLEMQPKSQSWSLPLLAHNPLHLLSLWPFSVAAIILQMKTLYLERLRTPLPRAPISAQTRRPSGSSLGPVSFLEHSIYIGFCWGSGQFPDSIEMPGEAGAGVQLVGCLPSMHEGLGSPHGCITCNPSS